MTLRNRIALATTSIVTVVIVAMSFATFLTMSRQLINQTDESLNARVTAIAESLRNNRPSDHFGKRLRNPLGEAILATRFDSITQVVNSSGEVMIAVGAVDLPVTDDILKIAQDPFSGHQLSTVRISGTSYRMLTIPLSSGGAVQLAKDISEVERARQSILNWTLLFAALGFCSATLASWVIARQTTQPIQLLAEAAERVAATSNLGTVIDVKGDTEVQRLVNSFNSMLAALRASSQQQRQLVQDVSHEIRTPLTSLRANSELLDRADLPSDARTNVLRDIRAEVDELTALSGELTALATDQKLGEQISAVDADLVINEIAERARRRTGRQVIVHGATGTLHVRPNQFERAMNNLVDNALKFSQAPNPVLIESTEFMISVSDNGTGVSDADKPLIFDRFYRSSANRSLPGSGLGLAIVKQFVDDHSARIEIVDRPGGGTTIRIEFSKAN